MANRWTNPLSLGDYKPQAAARGPLADVPRDFNGSAATAAMGAISEKLAAKFGAIADQAAQVEGQRAGTAAGLDPAFKPSGSMTLRGQAYDRAGIQVYSSRLTAKLSSDMADLFDQTKDNPAAFQAGAARLRKQYEDNDVFPEVMPEFLDRFASLEQSYRTATRNNYEQARRDQDRAAMVTGLESSESTRARLLATGGDPAAMQRAIEASVADDLARIDALVASNALTAEAGAKMKIGLQSSAAVSTITAAAGRLATPAEIEAFRTTTRERFARGEIAGLSADDYNQLDAGLAQMATKLQTEGKAATNALEKQFEDFNDRLARGDTPSQAEWIKLNTEAAALGPEGQALAARAERRARLATSIASLPPDQAQAYVEQLTATARASRGTGRFEAPASANVNAVDPRLVDIMKSAAEQMGLTVRVTPSGGRNRRRAGTQNHPTGRALDLVIIDENGKPLPNFQNGKAFRRYEELAHAAKQIQEAKYPELADAFRWGGYFSGRWNADLMHFDVSGGGMAGGDWKTGLTPDMRAIYTDAESMGIDQAPKVASGGMSAETADDLAFARKLVDQKTKAYSDDMLGAAASEGLVSSPTILVPGRPDTADLVAARVAQADAVAGARSRAPQYIRPSEKPAILAALGQGGDQALQTLTDIVRGAGSKAPAILRELGQDAPVMAQAGSLIASGGSAVAVRDALEAVRLKRDGASLPAPSPSDQMTILGETISTSLSTNPDERNRIGQLANFIFGARAARLNVDPASSEARSMYRTALQEAAGAVIVNGEQFGGFIEYGGGFSGRFSGVVSVPPGVSATKLPSMIDAIRPEDLSSLAIPPVDPDGKPVPVSDIQQALPVRYGNGFRFQLEDPQTGEPVFIRGADGRPFTLPASALRDIYTLRLAVGDN